MTKFFLYFIIYFDYYCQKILSNIFFKTINNENIFKISVLHKVLKIFKNPKLFRK